MRKFLIVGSSGQIGTALAVACRSNSIPALGLDARPNFWDPSITSIQMNLLEYIPRLSDDITDIIFLATEASSRRLVENPDFSRKDYLAFAHAIDLATRCHSRLSIVSSRELFGVAPDKIFGFVPRNAYEKQKKDFEMRLYELREIDYGVLRIPIAFGGYDTDIDRLPRLIPRWCQQVLKGEKIEVIHGEETIELVHISDVISRFLNILVNSSKSFLEEIRGVTISFSSLAKLIEEVYGMYARKKNGTEYDLFRLGIIATFQSLENRTLLH